MHSGLIRATIVSPIFADDGTPLIYVENVIIISFCLLFYFKYLYTITDPTIDIAIMSFLFSVKNSASSE